MRGPTRPDRRLSILATKERLSGVLENPIPGGDARRAQRGRPRRFDVIYRELAFTRPEEAADAVGSDRRVDAPDCRTPDRANVGLRRRHPARQADRAWRGRGN